MNFLDFLQQAGNTAVDIIAAKNSGPITSAGPTVNPAQLDAQGRAIATTQAVNPTNYTPFIIGGVAIVGVLVLTVVLARK